MGARPDRSTMLREASALALLALMAFAVLRRPISDVDIFWQLRSGEMALDRGALVTRESFAVSHLGEPLVPLAWLSQVIMAAVRRVGGWEGLHVFDTIVWCGGFATVGLVCRQRGCRPLAVAVALGLALLIALPSASVRPQSFAVLALGLALALARLDWPFRRTMVAGAVLFVAWQNLHPSVAIAAVVFTARAVAAWTMIRLRPRQSSAVVAWREMMLAALAAASVCATPAGTAILAVTAENARASVAMQVSEWLPLWAPQNRALLVPAIAAALLATAIIATGRGGREPRELAAAGVLAVMTAFSARMEVFLALALIPPVARAFSPDRIASPGRLLLAGGGAASLLAGAGLALLARPPLFHTSIPVEGIAALRRCAVRGPVFAHLPWGGPAIDGGWHVAFDGRYYRYGIAELEQYARIVEGRVALAEIDAAYRPAAFMLRPGYDDGLIARLQADPFDWRRVAAGGAAVFVRRGAKGC